MRKDGDTLLAPDERAAIMAQMDKLRALAANGDSQAIQTATESLNHATENFAARRMDASVRQAFAGQDLNTLKL